MIHSIPGPSRRELIGASNLLMPNRLYVHARYATRLPKPPENNVNEAHIYIPHADALQPHPTGFLAFCTPDGW